MDTYPTSITFNGITHYRSERDGYYRPHITARRQGVGDLHVEVWKAANGEIPSGYHVHHIDWNPSNPEIANLACLSPLEHARLHAPAYSKQRAEHMRRIQPLGTAWNQTEAAREHHQRHTKNLWKFRKPIRKVCERCGNEFDGQFNQRFCSADCKYKVDRTCVQCGKTFETYRTRLTQHCSHQCAWITRKADKAA